MFKLTNGKRHADKADASDERVEPGLVEVVVVGLVAGEPVRGDYRQQSDVNSLDCQLNWTQKKIRSNSEKCFVRLPIPRIIPVSLLETGSRSKLVKQLADTRKQLSSHA